MAKRKTSSTSGIFEAYTSPGGVVTRGIKINMAEAVSLRNAGKDVVVCGPDDSANRQRAEAIERAASVEVVHHAPHPNAGPGALWHFQPLMRPPAGHTFYERSSRKAQ
jgi:hypothetical protein